jgi:arginyl-tRNA synthetase
LVKKFNGFYQNNSILKAEDSNIVAFRLLISKNVGDVIKHAMNCLGIQVPKRM